MQARIDTLIDLALQEDCAFGDVTSKAIFSAGHTSTAEIVARQDLVVCGVEISRAVFERLDPALGIEACHADGDRVGDGERLIRATGSTIALLSAERTVLNFLQRLSGIATLSRRFARAAKATGTPVRVLDTRKTTPGWRALEKYAVRTGGCENHRTSLGEQILIKDNHIAAAGSIVAAVSAVRERAPVGGEVEVEVSTFDEVHEALEAGADVIMLDNMSPAGVRTAVELIDGRALVEISGGVRLETLADYAMAGVDRISIGALTHSAPAADISMNLSALQAV